LKSDFLADPFFQAKNAPKREEEKESLKSFFMKKAVAREGLSNEMEVDESS